MKNTFKFSYLTPTPDTLANIALCRWNDALKGLPAFIQIYMQSQHFLQGFGFSRALSYKEYLNKKITKDTDLKVYVGGYEINLSELLVDHDLDLVKISSGASNLVTFFRITFETEEVLLDSNFISHDGTSIPVTEQNITITVELCYSDSTNWNFETQKPLSDLRGNTASVLFDMENDDNSDGLYGRDCTLWTTPTEKTIYGYKWQCALPISFLMPDNLSVSNIYFDRQSGEFEALYTVPVVKRFFQNIEKAIYDTHLLNCLHDYNKTEEEIDENNNEYIVVGGVNLDENTENLYPIGDDNDHIEYIISEMQSDITNTNSRMVTTHSINSETVGDNQDIFGEKSFKNSSNFWAKTDFNDDINVNLYRGQGYTPTKIGIINTGDEGGIAIRGCCNVGDNVFELWRDNDDNILMWVTFLQEEGTYSWERFKTTINTDVVVHGNITTDYDILPSTNETIKIGSRDKKISKIYTKDLSVKNIDNFDGSSYQPIKITASVYVTALKINIHSNVDLTLNSNGISLWSGNTFNIGSNSIPINSLYTKNIDVSTSAKLPHITYNEGHGSVSASTTIPIGGIVCVRGDSVASLSVSLSYPGQEFTIGTNEYIVIASLDNSSVSHTSQAVWKITEGTFVVLSGIKNDCGCLVQRIS